MSAREEMKQRLINGPLGLMEKEAERYVSKVAFGEHDACWEWQGHKNWGGYGQFYFRGRDVSAHRTSLQTHDGLGGSLEAMHACDNRPCVNPAHLSWGTHAQNMRGSRAGRPPGSKSLPRELVCEIIEKSKTLSLRQLARMYGKSTEHIHYITRKSAHAQASL